MTESHQERLADRIEAFVTEVTGITP